MVIFLIMAFGALQANRLAAAQTQWGGQGEQVWRATRTVPAGQPVAGALRAIKLPRAAIPPTAVTTAVEKGAVLAVPLVEGALLTTVHIDPVGPAAALPDDERAVPIPVEQTWGIEPGSVVDVWAVVDNDEPPEALAQDRPVLQLSEGGPRSVALISLHEDDVAATTATLARGRVLLTLRGGAASD